MAIKWSALEVAEAMDKVEQQLNLAEGFLAEAEDKAREATSIADLPQYLSQRLYRLIYIIKGRRGMKDAIDSVRSSIPDGAVEADQKRRNQGMQQSLLL